MRDFSKQRLRHTVGRFFLRLIGLCALLLIAFIMTRATWGMYQKFSEAAAQSAEAQQNLAALQAEKAQVRASVEALTSPRGVEGELRREYGVAKPGEGEIAIIRDATSSPAPSAPSGNLFSRIFHALLPF